MIGMFQIYHSLTQLCNWKCPYCEFPVLKNPKTIVDIDKFKRTLQDIKNVTDKYDLEHCVEGGELGLLSPDILDVFFNSGLAEKYHVATNGKFLEKGYHKKYKDKILSILYHVKPEILEADWDVKRYDTYGIPFYYTIVITKENIDIAGKFFDYNNDLNFVPHILQLRRKDISLMNIDYYKKVYEIVQRDNVNEGFERRYKYITENFENNTFMEVRNKMCCNDYTKMMIEYTTNSLIRCCVTTETDRIELTMETLDKALSNDEVVFPIWDETCQKCIATFNFKDIYYVPYDKISIKNHLNFKKCLKKVINVKQS